VIGLPLTLVVAEFGTLFGFLRLFLSPVRALRTLPTTGQAEPAAAPG
jgi:hypothetical protein